MLETVVELSWRGYPAALLAALGGVLILRGVRRGWGWSRHRDPARNLAFMRGFRLAIIGLALAGIAGAWAWHLGWLLVLALVIGVGELLESSLDVWAVSRGIRHGYVPARPASSPDSAATGSGGPPSNA